MLPPGTEELTSYTDNAMHGQHVEAVISMIPMIFHDSK